ncbi:hypothetical protein RI845_15595 [Thalassotalea nanhaiensis]|uniref:Uncharacterized protein n=1 Tax=Thalassotalea nanhaiensis TaxID=3065648 RepID=A0ABY9TGL1_9GAMM|nr:hypothetical protein RI845_15595 [Colwelliaceae bacterium SQ345]
MDPIKFFKLQVKNLHKDLKTRYEYKENGYTFTSFKPKFFDLDQWFLDGDEEPRQNYTLMQAQQVFANMMDFNCWDELISAPRKQLELMVLLFKDKVTPQEWREQVIGIEMDNGMGDLTEDYIFQKSVYEQVYMGKDTIMSGTFYYLLYDFK